MKSQLKIYPSLRSKIEWEELYGQQKIKIKQKLKSEIAVLLIEATFHVKSKNYTQAKQIFCYVADLCLTIQQPDSQVNKWIDISFRFIGLLHLQYQESSQSQQKSSEPSIAKKKSKIKLKYNKLINQFEFQKDKDGEQSLSNIQINQDLLKYVSKINSILFGQKNSNQQSSIFKMFISYWLAFIFVLLFLILSFVILVKSEYFINQIEGNNDLFGPEILLGAFCIFPIIFIFVKSPYQKDNIFFQKKISQCIRLINEDCVSRKIQYNFLLQDNGKKITIKQTKPVNQNYNIGAMSPSSPCIQSLNESDKQYFKSLRKHEQPKQSLHSQANSIFIYDQSLYQKQFLK